MKIFLKQLISPARSRRAGVFFTIFAVLFFFPAVFHILPFPELSEYKEREISCRIYDRNRNLIQVTPLKTGERREFTPISKIPKAIQSEFIKREDRRFYFHHGIDYLSIANSLFQNLIKGKVVRGGSTISMQLAKAINKDNSLTFTRKFHDIFFAWRLEAKLSKKEILELYLNSIYFGNGSYGITSAARTFFCCELSELSETQIQILSVMPRNPTFYNPVKYPNHFDIISPEAENTAKKAKIFSYPFHMPHFVQFLKSEKSGICKNGRLPYEIHTSVDLQINRTAQNFLRKALDLASDSRISNGSLLLLNNTDGSVISWIGNADFFDTANGGQIDGVLVQNQPGSSMKPFLYALAIEEDILSPASVIADVPTAFGSDKLYIPENFNNRFNGPVRTRIALASSLNVPAVSTLNKIGISTYLDKLYELGFESLKENNRGLQADLGLALGAGEVSLYELVPAFSIFTRDGVFFPIEVSLPESELNRKNRKTNAARQIYTKDTARLICSILSDKAARSLGFGYTQTFQTDYPSIFKTGTSNQYQDIVALGATKHFTIGVWMGNFSGQTVMGKTGSSLPAWVAKNVLDSLEGLNPYDVDNQFPKPEHWHKERICSLSGMKAGPECRSVVTEYVKDNSPPAICNWHIKVKGSTEANTIYPPEYQQWLRQKNTVDLQEFSFIEHAGSPLTFLTPKDGSIFFYSRQDTGKQAISFELTGGAEDQLQIFYDEQKIGSINRPFVFSLPVERGEHTCRVICGYEELSLSFTVK